MDPVYFSGYALPATLKTAQTHRIHAIAVSSVVLNRHFQLN